MGKLEEKWTLTWLSYRQPKKIELQHSFTSTPTTTKMATKQPLRTTFDADRVIRPIFTGGSVSIDKDAQILATTIGEDAVLTNPATGKHLGQIEGVRTF